MTTLRWANVASSSSVISGRAARISSATEWSRVRRVTLPPRAEMRAQIATYDAALRKRFVASKRHTIEVDFHTYLAELAKERKVRAQPPGSRR